ncbi:hypothetical protein [uncultured Tateyamaria sp.]|uniref:hypothetical protein n=1 Tax=Tateyamaria sp. 1078 TaxID=3417464 RepID=UPI0026306A64|nr:hypothetical protein [uncultured Tateyamaria sp.]
MIQTLLYLAVVMGAFALGRMSMMGRYRLRSSDGGLMPPRPDPGDMHDATRRPMTWQRFIALIFLIIWLVAWSVACLAVLKLTMTGTATLFLTFWLIVSVAFWMSTVHTIFRLATGKPVEWRTGRVM